MLPYPYKSAGIMAVFCFRENVLVRKRHECWTCSWCQPGSDVITASAPEAEHCAAMKRAVRIVIPNASAGRRAA